MRLVLPLNWELLRFDEKSDVALVFDDGTGHTPCASAIVELKRKQQCPAWLDYYLAFVSRVQGSDGPVGPSLLSSVSTTMKWRGLTSLYPRPSFANSPTHRIVRLSSSGADSLTVSIGPQSYDNAPHFAVNGRAHGDITFDSCRTAVQSVDEPVNLKIFYGSGLSKVARRFGNDGNAVTVKLNTVRNITGQRSCPRPRYLNVKPLSGTWSR